MGLVATLAAALEIVLSTAWPHAGGTAPVDVGWVYTWRTLEAQAISGRPTRIMQFYPHCHDGFRPAVGATATHGTLTTKDGMSNVCGEKTPTTELWYQSAPGFHGVDNVEVAAPFYVEIQVTVR